MQNNKIITVFGGSGFLGRAMIRQLAAAGYTVRVATRNPLACYDMRPYGTPGQVVAQVYDPARPDTIGAVISGSYGVVNCVGVLYERGRSTFHNAHVELPRAIATACKRYNVARFVHVSALGVQAAKSKYGRSKVQGEKTVRDIYPGVCILRPSVIFGADDNFFNMFARLATVLPVLPLIGGGHTKFQPVYVGDVAGAVAACVTGPQTGVGKTYELGGPDVVSFRDLYQLMFSVTGQPRFLLPIPMWAARIQGSIMGLMPKPMLTADQVKSLETDSVVTGPVGFADLGIIPVAMNTILPTYLSRFRQGGKFAENKFA